MHLLNILAQAHLAGNRIDLSWVNPDPAGFPGVRVVRREGTHPVSPEDGVIVLHDDTGQETAADNGLSGETVYYYSLFPFRGNPPQFDIDAYNRVSTMATAPYNFSGMMYAHLPAIYRRYDASRLPAPGSGAAAEDEDKGELRRFLDLPGSQLDRLYSLARSVLNFYNLDRTDGNLLPLLAQWIGWRIDFRQEVGAQRNEIRFAPYLYRTIGLMPTVEATVKRITGWESRTKEFMHNVARTNQPERLNLWSMLRDTNGVWGQPALASLNWIYEGRPAAVREADGSLLFFYHTYRRHGWDIWAKRFSGGQWQPSEPVVDQPSMDKHPTAAIQGSNLWLFWDNYDADFPEPDRRWRIHLRFRENGAWSPVETFRDAAIERQHPAAVADNQGGVWLFWLENDGGWKIKYNRHDGNDWQLATPAAVPLDAGERGPDGDLFVYFHPGRPQQRLWVFWSRQEPGGPAGQTRSSIVFRIKRQLDPTAADWQPAVVMPKTGAGGYHDREPAVVLGQGVSIELYWSSTQGGGWSVWRRTINPGTLNFGATEQLTTSPYSERAPLAVDTGSGTLLTFRSNQSLEYTSTVYGATRTLDVRYAGTTTLDTGSAAKITLRGQFEDFMAYTYDSGRNGERSNDDRIARDTVGLYLTPDIADPDEIRAMVSRLRQVLPEFMPITERAVFITP